MTFPGESLAATGSGNVTGAPIGPGTVTYRADSSTFGPGDEAWVDVPLSPLLLAPGDTAEVSWVLEVIGGSGVLDLTEDAGSLGSHPASAGTLVVPSSLTAADVTAGGTARLTIACTSGTVQVQQVKLRVWPAGGPLGGYSAPYTPPPVSVNLNMRRAPGTVYETPTYLTGTDRGAVMDATQSTLRGEFDATQLGDVVYDSMSNPLDAGFYALVQETFGALPPVRGSGVIGGGVCYLERVGDPYTPDPAGTFGVDWIYPPNEVPDDPDGWQHVGAPEWGWYQGTATIVNTPDVAGPAAGSFLVGGDNVADVDPPSATFGDVTDAAPTIAGMTADDLDNFAEFALPPIGAAGWLTRLTFYHEGAKGSVGIARSTSDATSASDTTGNAQASVYLGRYIDGVFFPIQASYTRPYRYWSPTAAPVTKLRQYNRDDGLGVAPRRAYGGASRNNTGRAYGYT